MQFIRISIFTFATFLVFSCCNAPRQNNDRRAKVNIDSVYQQILKDSVLVTGWYAVSDTPNGFRRQLDTTGQNYFIDPKPILVKAHFEKLTLKDNDFAQPDNFYIIMIEVYEQHNERWADATENAIGKRLGLVINDQLVSAPMVNARIESGMSSMHGRDKTKMEHYVKQLEADAIE